MLRSAAGRVIAEEEASIYIIMKIMRRCAPGNDSAYEIFWWRGQRVDVGIFHDLGAEKENHVCESIKLASANIYNNDNDHEGDGRECLPALSAARWRY